MNRIAMSPAAAGLLRALIARSGVAGNRILLTEARSIDWRSLTFTGERHHLELRIPGPDSGSVMQRMCSRLEDCEFSIPGIIVADIAVTESATDAPDGSTCFTIEALTIVDD
jgi:hypothetical protein